MAASVSQNAAVDGREIRVSDDGLFQSRFFGACLSKEALGYSLRLQARTEAENN